MSPIVDRGLVIVHVGGHNDGALTAFDARTGDVKWAWTGDGPAYGSPIVAELGGTRQVITMTQENLVGVAVADGQLLWKRPYTVRATRNAVTPIVHNQIVIVSGLGMPVSGFRVFNKAGQWSIRRRVGQQRRDDGHEHRRGDRQQPVRLLAEEQRTVLRDRREHGPDRSGCRSRARATTPPWCAPAICGSRSTRAQSSRSPGRTRSSSRS